MTRPALVATVCVSSLSGTNAKAVKSAAIVPRSLSGNNCGKANDQQQVSDAWRLLTAAVLNVGCHKNSPEQLTTLGGFAPTAPVRSSVTFMQHYSDLTGKLTGNGRLFQCFQRVAPAATTAQARL